MDFEIMKYQLSFYYVYHFYNPSVLPLDGEMQKSTIVQSRKI